MRIEAAILEGIRQPFRIETLELAEPREDEVLVRMQAAGVCHSDWHLVTGDSKCPLPLVAGHEGAGIVVAKGAAVTRVKPGDRVILSWAPHCGRCYFCTSGRKCLCPDYTAKRWAGVLMDGTPRLSRGGSPVYHFCATACFADHAVVHESSCVPVAGEVDPAIAAIIGCAVTTGVGAVLRTARVERGSSVVVIGAGGVGLCIIMAAKLAEAGDIIAIDPSADRAAMARRFGATHCITDVSDPAAVIARVKELTSGRGGDYVFEAVGRPAIQEQALAMVRPGGAVILAGLSAMGSSTNLPGAVITRREITVMGSYYGGGDPFEDFPLYAQWHRDGRLPLGQLVGRTYKLDQINEAYRDLLEGHGGRGVIVW